MAEPARNSSAAMPTVAEALQEAARRGLDHHDAQVLMSHLTGRGRAWLITHDDHRLDATQAARWSDWLARRLDDVPVAYLTGERGFHGLILQITPDVLDPRPDTETLVDWALEIMAARPMSGRALDLGTGSGAIALALKAAHPDWWVTATDRSPEALAVARDNSARLRLAIEWHEGAWFEALTCSSGPAGPTAARFDLIVSNPPYLRADDPHLPALRHEPQAALVGGEDGLADLSTLVAGAPDWLQPGGWLLLEHGHDQADDVAALMAVAGWTEIAHRTDLGGHRRCTGARRPPQHAALQDRRS